MFVVPSTGIYKYANRGNGNSIYMQINANVLPSRGFWQCCLFVPCDPLKNVFLEEQMDDEWHSFFRNVQSRTHTQSYRRVRIKWGETNSILA